MLVDLVLIAIALKHAAKDARTPHPNDLDWQACIGSTLALTRACVTTLSLRSITAVFP